MQEDILLVPYQDLSQWPNDLHLQFNQTQDEQMDAEFDVDNPAPGKLATAIADHKAAVATENSAYIVSRSSEYTEQIAEQDSIRDTKIDEATSVANAMSKVASLPAMQQAALTRCKATPRAARKPRTPGTTWSNKHSCTQYHSGTEHFRMLRPRIFTSNPVYP